MFCQILNLKTTFYHHIPIMTSFQVFLDFINKNHTNITKLTTTADDETIVVVDGSDNSAVGSACSLSCYACADCFAP